MAEVVVAAAIGFGVSEYQRHETKKDAKKAEKKARQRQEQRELQAGEYWEEQNRNQMEMQSQGQMIKTLADILMEEEDPTPEYMTLPAPVEFTPMQKINDAIDKMLNY